MAVAETGSVRVGTDVRRAYVMGAATPEHANAMGLVGWNPRSGFDRSWSSLSHD